MIENDREKLAGLDIFSKLPADTDFSSLIKFKRSIASMDFSDYLQCF